MKTVRKMIVNTSYFQANGIISQVITQILKMTTQMRNGLMMMMNGISSKKTMRTMWMKIFGTP